MSAGLCLGEKIFQFLHPVLDPIGGKRGQGVKKLTGLVCFHFLGSPVCFSPFSSFSLQSLPSAAQVGLP